jgi:hypothetical protein
MRRPVHAPAVITLVIAVYFALAWGFDALAMLRSPAFGLDDVWGSQFLFVLGRLVSLSPIGLIKLAAFFATLKLAAALACLGYVAAAIRAWPARHSPDVLEAGLILIVAISILAVGPAVWAQDAALVRRHTIDLALAGLAVALCLVERHGLRANGPAAAAINSLKVLARLSPWR